MTVIELLNKEREDYLSIWMSSLMDYRSKFPLVVAEVLLEIKSSGKASPYCFIRPDLMCGGAADPKIIEVNKDRYYNFEPLTLHALSEVPGKLFPMHWNGMEFRLYGEIESWDYFEKWVHQWMDLDDARNDKEKELSNVIHNVTVPKKVGDYFEFSVDMGSAGVDAFTELLSLYPVMHVTKFEIGSFSMIDIRNS